MITDEGEYAAYIVATPDGIFYVNSDTGYSLEYVSLNGERKYRVADSRTKDFAVAGEWIFYVNEDDENALWMVRTDGTDEQRVGE